MYSIDLTKKAERFLKKISKTDSEIILKKIYSIREAPFQYVKRLEGSKLWRLRVMDYRVIVDILISGRRIVILRIGPRKNIYKNLAK